jgi:hypothetical protein
VNPASLARPGSNCVPARSTQRFVLPVSQQPRAGASHLRGDRSFLAGQTGTLMEAIDLIEDTRGGGGMSVVFSAGRELYPWRAEPAVQEVNDRLLALMAKN